MKASFSFLRVGGDIGKQDVVSTENRTGQTRKRGKIPSLLALTVVSAIGDDGH